LLIYFAAEEAGGIGALGLDVFAIAAQAITFLVLFYIIKKFALEKIVKTLEDRRKTIDQGVRLGIEMQAEKEQLEETIDAQLHKTRTETDKILVDAHQEAGAIIKQAEGTALEKVDGLIADAHVRIEDDVRRAKIELEKEMVKLVAEAAEIVLLEKIDANKDEVLIKKALAGVKR